VVAAGLLAVPVEDVVGVVLVEVGAVVVRVVVGTVVAGVVVAVVAVVSGAVGSVAVVSVAVLSVAVVLSDAWTKRKIGKGRERQHGRTSTTLGSLES
jgi:hypothetical protein